MKFVELVKHESSKEENSYGLIDLINNDLIIPCNNRKDELENVKYVYEVFPNIYILYKTNNKEDIVGFYDASVSKLVKSNNTSYEIYKDILIFKNKVITSKGSNKDYKIDSKTYIRIYDTKFKNFIENKKMYGISGEKKELDTRFGDFLRGFHIEGIFIHDDILFFKTANVFYDIRTGKLYENYEFCVNENENIFLKGVNNNKFKVGEYDILSRDIKEYIETPIKNLYLIQNTEDEYRYFDPYKQKLSKVIKYSDFYIFQDCYEMFLFSKDFKVIKNTDKMFLKITEFSYEESINLGIPKKSVCSTYMINGKLYEYTNRKYSFGSNDDFPFTEIPGKIISYHAFEYGYGIIESDSLTEYDYKISELEKEKARIENNLSLTFLKNESLQNDYPKLVKKK